LGYLYNVLIVDEQDFKDIGKEKPTEEFALAKRLEKILKFSDPDFVDKVFERNETSLRATIRILDMKKRKRLLSINKKIVETFFSPRVVGEQLYHVITSSN